MVEDMGLPITAFQHGQSANLAGLATGCALFVPLTIKYGRRSTYVMSVAVMAAACWWTAKRTTYAEVILTSIILGWAGAINETVVQMTVRPSIERSDCLAHTVVMLTSNALRLQICISSINEVALMHYTNSR
jgi:MFS family permease